MSPLEIIGVIFILIVAIAGFTALLVFIIFAIDLAKQVNAHNHLEISFEPEDQEQQ